ncbi:MAG: UbiA family prenyltransferase [Chloroflexi bacterium]|nr:UbiA family prenyltransferase [Chloroflexota bacterium]
MSKPVKSTITSDMEGRIETFNQGAEEIFGYSANEVIGKKRVSLFSPGLTVLEHVPTWLKTAREEGEYTGRTVFVRKDGSRFAADIRITPTWRDGEQIGYCGVTTPLPDVPVEEAAQTISPVTRVFAGMVVTRAPFLTATIIPILVGAAWVAATGAVTPFPWLLFALTMLGGIALHIAANTFNDYFDWQSGTDPLNNDYFLPLSGGSRSIELGLISEQGLLRLALAVSGIATAIGIVLLTLRGWPIIVFGLIGLAFAYFYTAPPVRLAARKGLGELVTGLSFGPLMVAGTVYTLSGSLTLADAFLGLPIGLLITAVLWINEFPDLLADKATGKINAVVVLGKSTARWGYLLIVAGAFGLIVAGVATGLLPLGTLLMLAALPVGTYTTWYLFKHYQDRELVRANQLTIALHVVAGVLLTVGLLISDQLISLI